MHSRVAGLRLKGDLVLTIILQQFYYGCTQHLLVIKTIYYSLRFDRFTVRYSLTRYVFMAHRVSAYVETTVLMAHSKFVTYSILRRSISRACVISNSTESLAGAAGAVGDRVLCVQVWRPSPGGCRNGMQIIVAGDG